MKKNQTQQAFMVTFSQSHTLAHSFKFIRTLVIFCYTYTHSHTVPLVIHSTSYQNLTYTFWLTNFTAIINSLSQTHHPFVSLSHEYKKLVHQIKITHSRTN